MRTEAATWFERAWSRLEAADDVRVEELHLAGEERASVALAVALRDLGRNQDGLDTEAAWNRIVWQLERRPRTHRPARAQRHWMVRVIAAAAAVVALVVASLRAEPGSVLYPVRTSLERTALVLLPSDSSLHLRIAEARLDDLLHVLSRGPAGVAPGVARALVDERAAARAGGADVSALDARIGNEVPPALGGVPPSIAAEVRGILGPLLPRGAGRPGPHAGQPGVTQAPTPAEGRETSPSVESHGGTEQEPGNHERSGGSEETSGPSSGTSTGPDEGPGGSDTGSGADGSAGGTEGTPGGTGDSEGTDSGGSGQNSGGSDGASGEETSGGGDAQSGGGATDGTDGSSGSDASSGEDGTSADAASGDAAQAADAAD